MKSNNNPNDTVQKRQDVPNRKLPPSEKTLRDSYCSPVRCCDVTGWRTCRPMSYPKIVYKRSKVASPNGYNVDMNNIIVNVVRTRAPAEHENTVAREYVARARVTVSSVRTWKRDWARVGVP